VKRKTGQNKFQIHGGVDRDWTKSQWVPKFGVKNRLRENKNNPKKTPSTKENKLKEGKKSVKKNIIFNQTSSSVRGTRQQKEKLEIRSAFLHKQSFRLKK